MASFGGKSGLELEIEREDSKPGNQGPITLARVTAQFAANQQRGPNMGSAPSLVKAQSTPIQATRPESADVDEIMDAA